MCIFQITLLYNKVIDKKQKIDKEPYMYYIYPAFKEGAVVKNTEDYDRSNVSVK